MASRNVLIIGSGPAALTAALYTSRANLEPLVIAGSGDKHAKIGGQEVDLTPGGQLMTTTAVENYPGFPEGVQGPDLMEAMRKQAERFGSEIWNEDITAVDFSRRPFRVTVSETKTVEALAVIISTGASPRHLGLTGESELTGRGVSTCATCDGAFFKGREIAVVGGGDSAMEEANFLVRFGTAVSVIHRRDEFRASKIMLDRARGNPKIRFRTPAAVTELLGVKEGKLAGARVKDLKTGEVSTLGCAGLFVAIGHEPNTGLFRGQIELDDKGYIVWKKNTQTSVPGVFAGGDCVDHRYRQAVTAAGMGCMAAIDTERYLEDVGH